MNALGMVDVALSAHDYVIIQRGTHYGRLHKLDRSRGYWLSWSQHQLVTIDTIEQAVTAFERVTGELDDNYQVQLAERRG